MYECAMMTDDVDARTEAVSYKCEMRKKEAYASRKVGA